MDGGKVGVVGNRECMTFWEPWRVEVAGCYTTERSSSVCRSLQTVILWGTDVQHSLLHVLGNPKVVVGI